MIVTARTQQRPSPDRDAPGVERDEIRVEASDYEIGKAMVLQKLPDGWIVAGWLVDRV